MRRIKTDDTVVETADKVNGKKYKQVFSQNMTKKGTPKVRELLGDVLTIDNGEPQRRRMDQDHIHS